MMWAAFDVVNAKDETNERAPPRAMNCRGLLRTVIPWISLDYAQRLDNDPNVFQTSAEQGEIYALTVTAQSAATSAE